VSLVTDVATMGFALEERSGGAGRAESTALAATSSASPVVKSILRKKDRRYSTKVVTSPKKKVEYTTATLRFYDYDIGGSVPGITKGPPLGLGATWKPNGELDFTVDELEELRGGNPPELDECESEEWNDNWRVPREYFADEGTIPAEKRIELLKEAGHRRPSIDLLTHETKHILASRKAESATTVCALILAGFDIDEIFGLDKEESASSELGKWAKRRLYLKKRAKTQRGC